MELNTALLFLVSLLPLLLSLHQLLRKRHDSAVYMLNYECYKPSDDRKMDTESSCRVVLRNRNMGCEQYKFLLKTIVSSGLGEETYSPVNIVAGREENPLLADALEELDDIFLQTLDLVFDKSGVLPQEIDVLVVNVWLLSPEPSLASRIVSRYRMRADVKAFNLSGMGCSASLVAVDLVRQLFKTHKNKSPLLYCGREKSMMLSNCLFRSGGCSMLLTNKRRFRRAAILELKHMAHFGSKSNDEAYNCCIQVEDDDGYRGFRLTKKLTKAAAQAFILNLRVLVPKMLPPWEIARFLAVSVRWGREQNHLLEGVGKGLNLKSGV